MINEIRNKNIVPHTWKEATITLIHKQGLDPKDVRNYRPISLINSDYKIFANLLANRFKKILSQIIHQDQTGFLPCRNLRNNIRIITNILEYYEQHSEKAMAIVFVDAEKAFDNVCWDFMISHLKAVLGDDDFMKMIATIYEEQRAKILINGKLTDYIDIARGTRQGCPISFTIHYHFRDIQ